MQAFENQPSDDVVPTFGGGSVHSRPESVTGSIEEVMREAMTARRSFMSANRMKSTVKPGESGGSQSSADLVIDGAFTVASPAAGSPSPAGSQSTAIASGSVSIDGLSDTVPTASQPEVKAKASRAPKAPKAKKASKPSSANRERDAEDGESLNEGLEASGTELSEEEQNGLDEEAALRNAGEDLDDAKVDSDAKDALKAADADSLPPLKRALRLAPLTKEEFDELHAKHMDGDSRAFEKMVNHSMRLVVSCARRYLNRGAQFDDLIQEGAMGLMHGIGKYQPELGYRPASYLFHWIRQRMGRYVDHSVGVIRAPSTAVQGASKLHTEASRAEAEGAENAAELRRRSDAAYNDLNHGRSGVSMDCSLGEDSGETIGDMLVDSSADIETTVAHRQTLELLIDSINSLDERSRFIIAAKTELLIDRFEDLNLSDWLRKNDMREFMVQYTDGSGRGRSLRDLGDALGISAERCNQIYRQCMDQVASEMACAVGGKQNLSVGITNFDTDALDRKASEQAERASRASAVKVKSNLLNEPDTLDLFEPVPPPEAPTAQPAGSPRPR